MSSYERHFLLKLLPNRVRRNYRGGAGIDRLQGKSNPADGDRPEEWVASLVAAKNPGLPPVKDEGYSLCGPAGSPVPLADLLRDEPEWYLGEELFRRNGIDLGFLLKILDSSMRLHVQAHPTAAFAQQRLNSRYGKLECYYILDVRPGTNPYIRLGFQRLPHREEWKRIILEQDIPAMDRCFTPVPVKSGEVWHIPGGMPHAIGENILMLEIMEPSDLVVRCEFEREGVTVPPEARFMGKGLDFCLDIFHYEEKSVEEITQKYRLTPRILESGPGFTVEEIVGAETSSSFRVHRLSLEPGKIASLPGGICRAALATRNGALFSCDHEEVSLGQGEGLFIAAKATKTEVRALPERPAEICFVLPA
jgi:mannose-6-phosphate isomerase